VRRVGRGHGQAQLSHSVEKVRPFVRVGYGELWGAAHTGAWGEGPRPRERGPGTFVCPASLPTSARRAVYASRGASRTLALLHTRMKGMCVEDAGGNCGVEARDFLFIGTRRNTKIRDSLRLVLVQLLEPAQKDTSKSS
jgi:hypothetical protein